MKNKFKFYITAVIIFLVLIFVFRDLYTKYDTRKNGVEIIVKFDSIQKLPKRSYYYFSYYLEKKKISTSNSGLKTLFSFNKIDVVCNKFYYAKRNITNPEVIIVDQTNQVTDTLAILKAGFSREDIISK